jgi:hypothetical protein
LLNIQLHTGIDIVKMFIFILPLNHSISSCLSNLLGWTLLKNGDHGGIRRQLPIFPFDITDSPRTLLSVKTPWYSHPVQLQSKQDLYIDDWTGKG